MDNFSKPAAAKLPPVVPLSNADEERQNLYKDLEKPLTEADAPSETAETPHVVPALTWMGSEAETPDPLAEPTDTDKQNFLRSILGSTCYEREYQLYGASVKVLLRDRTTQATESLYTQLDADFASKDYTEEQWQVALERYQLASTLVSLRVGPKANAELQAPAESLAKRVEQLLALSKPLYSALMQTSRVFETHVAILTSRAQDPTFWSTGGAASR